MRDKLRGNMWEMWERWKWRKRGEARRGSER
jgi:hypothetical protein